MDEPKIKPQYKLVASYYCGECAGNAEQSVIRAGYSRKYARGNAHKLVARPEVQEYIKYLNIGKYIILHHGNQEAKEDLKRLAEEETRNIGKTSKIIIADKDNNIFTI